jgi:hypothetical protein
MLNRAACLTLTCAMLVLLAASPAKADTLYTTGGTPPALGYSATSLLGVNTLIAESFVTAETANLTDAILPLWEAQDFPSGLPPTPGLDKATVYIESSSSGAPSGTILDTLTTTGTITASPSELLTFTCAICSQPTLASGVTYFLAAEKTAGNDDVNWTEAALFAGASYGSSMSPAGPWYATGTSDFAFEVDGTPVSTPEPSSLLLLGGGLLALVAIGRRKFAANGLAQS